MHAADDKCCAFEVDAPVPPDFCWRASRWCAVLPHQSVSPLTNAGVIQELHRGHRGTRRFGVKTKIKRNRVGNRVDVGHDRVLEIGTKLGQNEHNRRNHSLPTIVAIMIVRRLLRVRTSLSRSRLVLRLGTHCYPRAATQTHHELWDTSSSFISRPSSAPLRINGLQEMASDHSVVRCQRLSTRLRPANGSKPARSSRSSIL